MYQPLQVKNPNPKPDTLVSAMATKGENLRQLPQFLDVDYAQKIVNYLVDAEGQLYKRGGLAKIFEVAGNVPITMLKKFTDDIYLFAYGTTVASYTFSTNTVATIKSDFSTSDPFDGARYGDYFFVCNGGDKIGRIDSATLTYTEVATAPQAKVLRVIGARLFAGNLSTNESAVAYAQVDDGSDPPFTNWTVDSLADGPGLVTNRFAGPVRAIEPLGENIVVFYDNGKIAFYINTFDSGGTISKADIFQMSRFDFGGARGAVTTPQGLLYVNEMGLNQLLGVGQPDMPLTDQELNSTYLLGSTYFDDITMTNADIVYNGKNQTCFVTCAKNSSTNNFVFAYNFMNKASTEISGWNINRWLKDNDIIYGAGSVKTAIWQCFTGSDDDGLPIGTEFLQELQTGSLFTRQMLLGCYVQGFLSPSTVINVKFDIYDVTGKLITDKLKYQWTAQYAKNLFDGWGTAQYASSSWGGDQDIAGLVESFDGCRPFIRNYQRIRLHITNSDKLPHTINWVSLQTKVKAPIRRRKMTQVT